MKRRNLIIGMGSFAAAGGAAVGTGAFSTAEATRDVSVQVANENNAYLSIKPSNTANGQFATQESSDNQIRLDFSGSGNGGSGVGQDSVYNFDDVFRISNQGTQTIYVWSRLSGGSKFDDNNLYFYPNGSRATELNDSSNSVLALSPGEGAKIGVHIDTESVSTGSDSITATIRADTDKPGNSGSVGPDGDQALVVSQDRDTGDFSSIQSAIDSADGTTIIVQDGTYNEQVTIDKSVEIRAAGGASPVITQGGSGDGIRLEADNITLRGIRVEQATHALDVPSNVNVQGLLVDNCEFDDSNTGMYVANPDGDKTTFDDITVRNTSFNGNDRKGIYAERLSNALFENIEVRNSGTADSYPVPNGIDINLKYGDYSDITIQGSTFFESGIETSGAESFRSGEYYGALVVKARGTGSDDAYDGSGDSTLDPATVSNVRILNNTFEFKQSTQNNTNTKAIQTGEPGAGDPDDSVTGTLIEEPTPGEEIEIAPGNEYINVDTEVNDLTQ